MQRESGVVRKMFVGYDEQTNKVEYHLNLDGQARLNLNNFIGQEIEISFLNMKFCVKCKRSIRGKTYSQGYCYWCFSTLPETDMCILKPEQCHYAQGTCRDSAWGEKHCFRTHYLYLANSSELKVGITRSLPTRWLDQGASEAVVIGKFVSRFEVGKAEKKLTEIFKDKTNWRNMLKGQIQDIDLFEAVDKAHDYLYNDYGEFLIKPTKSYQFIYPIKKYPKKISSLNLNKCIYIKDVLLGIKGQYLIFDDKVLNLRSHGGYKIEFGY